MSDSLGRVLIKCMFKAVSLFIQKNSNPYLCFNNKNSCIPDRREKSKYFDQILRSYWTQNATMKQNTKYKNFSKHNPNSAWQNARNLQKRSSGHFLLSGTFGEMGKRWRRRLAFLCHWQSKRERGVKVFFIIVTKYHPEFRKLGFSFHFHFPS